MKTKAEELLDVVNEVNVEKDLFEIEIKGVTSDEPFPFDQVKERCNLYSTSFDEEQGVQKMKILKLPSAEDTLASIKQIAQELKLELTIKGLE